MYNNLSKLGIVERENNEFQNCSRTSDSSLIHIYRVFRNSSVKKKIKYWVGKTFFAFFRKFPETAENVLEYSILGVYIDGMNTVRMTIKLSKWKLISN